MPTFNPEVGKKYYYHNRLVQIIKCGINTVDLVVVQSDEPVYGVPIQEIKDRAAKRVIRPYKL